MSTVKTNTLTGTTSAGSITITGEGGSTTTNLQAGILKHFVVYTSVTSTAVLNSQSLNHASLTDNGTGSTNCNLTNPMAQAHKGTLDCGGDGDSGYSSWTRLSGFSSTSTFQVLTGNDGFAGVDTAYHTAACLGDLA